MPRILLKKSKFERPRKSRESRFLDIPPAAKPCREDTNVRGRFCVKRCGPSYRRVRNASAVLKNFCRHPKKTFSTLSARSRHQEGAGIRPRSETANAISSKPASENQIIAYRMCWLRECERCRTSSSRSCNALDRRRQDAPTRLRQARWAASLHKMRRCGSGAFDVRYTLNSGAKSNVAGCPSWV